MSCGRKIGPYQCCSIVCGDALELMRELPVGSVDAVVTSPMYNLGGFHQMHGGNSAKWEYSGCTDDLPESTYQQRQIELCDLMFDKGIEHLFYSHKNRIVNGVLISPLYWLAKTKWVIHQQIVINKGSGANVDKRRFFPVHENIYVAFRTSSGSLSNSECLTDVWFVGDQQTNRKDIGHPAVMPESVALNCIASTMADVILDPHMGSGTTGVAAKRLGRHFLGFDISASSCEIARERIARVEAQPNLFEAKPEQLTLAPEPTV